MGEGAIVDQGTHNELLRDENGPYARLVQAQKLRERQANPDSDGDTPANGEWDDKEKAAVEEEPLRRKNTGRSLGSEIIEQKRLDGDDAHKNKDYSLAYLFMRMGRINSDNWWKYVLGTTFATSMQFFRPPH
jgi:ATP-binding cassette, subfamily B (MDR/TAP), member 1